jgi:hypothetical protein
VGGTNDSAHSTRGATHNHQAQKEETQPDESQAPDLTNNSNLFPYFLPENLQLFDSRDPKEVPRFHKLETFDPTHRCNGLELIFAMKSRTETLPSSSQEIFNFSDVTLLLLRIETTASSLINFHFSYFGNWSHSENSS